MSDRLTNGELAFYFHRLAEMRDRGEPAVSVRLHRMKRLIHELGRQRTALDQIRDITDPETHTEQPPMAAIRDALEDIDG